MSEKKFDPLSEFKLISGKTWEQWQAEAKAEYGARQGNGHDASGAPQPPKRLKTTAEFFAEHVPLNYLLEPAIDASGLYTLTAKTGSGKTAFLILLAIALAFERRDLFRNAIEPGRVAYLTCENPRNFRMRLMAAVGEVGIDVAETAGKLLIQDWYGTPEEMLASLKLHAADGPFKLIIIDTMASFFPGDNSNDNAQVMDFLRKVRPLTELLGSPTVIIAAHPVKNAADDNLIPYGGGAILNEVDGNLTMQKETSNRVTFHWQGKIRGTEFDPLTFELREITSTAVRDAKGALLKMPFLKSCDPVRAEDSIRDEGNRKVQILREIAQFPGQTQSELCQKLNILN